MNAKYSLEEAVRLTASQWRTPSAKCVYNVVWFCWWCNYYVTSAAASPYAGQWCYTICRPHTVWFTLPRAWTSHPACLASSRRRLTSEQGVNERKFGKSQTLRLNIKIKTHNAFFADGWSMCLEFRSTGRHRGVKRRRCRKGLTSTILRQWFVCSTRRRWPGPSSSAFELQTRGLN